MATQITNNMEAAACFARRFDGRVTYMPLTSTTRYTLKSDDDWARLGKLVKLMPVCLIETSADESDLACIAKRK